MDWVFGLVDANYYIQNGWTTRSYSIAQGLCAPNAGGMGSILGQETKIPHAAWPKKEKEKQILGLLDSFCPQMWDRLY